MTKYQQWHEKPPDNQDNEKFSNDINIQSPPINTGTNVTMVEEYDDLDKADLKTDIFILRSAHNESFVKSPAPSIDTASKDTFSCIISDKGDTLEDSRSTQSWHWCMHTSSDDDLSDDGQTARNTNTNSTVSLDGATDCVYSNDNAGCTPEQLCGDEAADSWSNQVEEQNLLGQQENTADMVETGVCIV